VRLTEDYNLVSTFEEADFHLFDILWSWLPSFPRFYLVGGLTIKIYPAYFDKLGVTALYIHKNTPLTEISAEAMLRISKIQYGPDLFPYGMINNQEIIDYLLYINRKTKKHKQYTKYPRLTKLLAGETQIEYNKVSSRHLRHLTIHEIRKKGMKYIDDNASFLKPWLEHMLSTDMQEALFVGSIVWASSLTPENKELMSQSGIWQTKYEDTNDFFNVIKKRFSLRLKAVQNLLPIDFTQMFELEVLVNRGLGTVDWHSEKINRTIPNLCNIDRDVVFNHALSLFKAVRGMGSRPRKTYWDSYWSSRNQWAPTGAYHSQYEEDMEFKSESREMRNKLFSLNAMPEYTIDHFLARHPSTVAWPSVKYEWGKQRAIYGVDATNFIISGFAMIGCEHVISPLFPIGPTATANNVSKTVSEVLKNGVPYCFDFEDFNSQHSVSSMQAVLEAYWAIYRHDFSDDQTRAMAWLIKSLEDCTIKAETGDYKVAGTLLSGWRLTTFMNTILNAVYTKEALGGISIATTHNGDDVLAGVKSIAQGQTLQRGAKRLNIRFQKNKCYLGAIAEFLRVDHKTGNGTQYLARGVSTFVHGPTESTTPNDLQAVIKSISTRKRELIERNADPDKVNDLVLLQLEHVSKIWRTSKADLIKINNTHVSLGGVTEHISEVTLSHQIERVTLKRIEDKRLEADRKKPLPGLHAYARKLTQKLIDPQYYGKIVEAGKQTIFSSAEDARFGVEIRSILPDQQTRLNAQQYGMLKTEQPGVKITMAKAFNLPLIAINADMSELAHRLAGEDDILKALRILI